eukprot:m.71404 g.71404  ORF g.71404 m.71404 type:complete len:179 (+) comp10066_c0_seq2:215-751(+)
MRIKANTHDSGSQAADEGPDLVEEVTIAKEFFVKGAEMFERFETTVKANKEMLEKEKEKLDRENADRDKRIKKLEKENAKHDKQIKALKRRDENDATRDKELVEKFTKRMMAQTDTIAKAVEESFRVPRQALKDSLASALSQASPSRAGAPPSNDGEAGPAGEPAKEAERQSKRIRAS